MAERLVLKEIRNKVDSKYVGFTPNGSAVKPVHIASGVLRCIYGEYNTTMLFLLIQIPLVVSTLRIRIL